LIPCAWTGKRIENYALDHQWKNNELWNLLPAARNVNAAKSDKIPAPELIERQRDRYTGILGNHKFNTWKEQGITQLQNSCKYL